MKVKQANTMKTHFKTELCKNWEKTGKCEFRESCAFAHGYEEM